MMDMVGKIGTKTVIVDDANILIDLANTGLLAQCHLLGFEFQTTDIVISELRNNRQRASVQEQIDKGELIVVETRGEDLIDVSLTYHQFSVSTNLSIADVSVMLLAERLGCRLLTSDQKLLHQARARGIAANGLLWLTDHMMQQRLVSPLEMVSHLQTLLDTNDRAPRDLVMERIDKCLKEFKEKNTNE